MAAVAPWPLPPPDLQLRRLCGRCARMDCIAEGSLAAPDRHIVLCGRSGAILPHYSMNREVGQNEAGNHEAQHNKRNKKVSFHVIWGLKWGGRER